MKNCAALQTSTANNKNVKITIWFFPLSLLILKRMVNKCKQWSHLTLHHVLDALWHGLTRLRPDENVQGVDLRAGAQEFLHQHLSHEARGPRDQHVLPRVPLWDRGHDDYERWTPFLLDTDRETETRWAIHLIYQSKHIMLISKRYYCLTELYTYTDSSDI